jgi:DNA-directed RNA polymerase specialized sigma24 family protein
MSSSGEGSITRWIVKLKTGEEEAAHRLWERYFDRLVCLARSELRARRREAVEDEEDAALTAFDSFCRGVARGKFEQLNDRDDLWRLLALITVRKARDQLQRQAAQKRGGGWVAHAAAEPSLPINVEGGDPGASGLDRILCREPSPEIAAMLADEYLRLGDDLGDDSLRRVLDLRMEGYTRQEIARRLGCAVRTVGRKLELIRMAMVAGGL